MSISLRPGQERDRDDLARALIDLQYTRNDMDFHREMCIRDRVICGFASSDNQCIFYAVCIDSDVAEKLLCMSALSLIHI